MLIEIKIEAFKWALQSCFTLDFLCMNKITPLLEKNNDGLMMMLKSFFITKQIALKLSSDTITFSVE